MHGATLHDAGSLSRPGPSLADLGATRATLRREMRCHLARPLLGTDALTWRNTSRALQLFASASLGGWTERRRAREDVRRLSCVFVLGAVEAAGDLVGLSRFGRHRIEHRVLCATEGVGPLRARRLRRALEHWSAMPTGRRAFDEGRAALLDWFRGGDPSASLRSVLEGDVPPRRAVESLDLAPAS